MITEIKEFLFDPLWYHGGNGVNSDHALGKFFIYQKEDSLVNPNKWDYYKNPCNNYDDQGNSTFVCKGHSRKTPWNIITPNQLLGLSECNCDFNISNASFYYQEQNTSQLQKQKFVYLDASKHTKNTVIDEYIVPRDLQFKQGGQVDYVKEIGKCVFGWRWFNDLMCITIEEATNLKKDYTETQKYDPSIFYSEDKDWCNIMYETKFGWIEEERPKDKRKFKFLILLN